MTDLTLAPETVKEVDEDIIYDPHYEASLLDYAKQSAPKPKKQKTDKRPATAPTAEAQAPVSAKEAARYQGFT